LKVIIQDILDVRHLDQFECPTGRAKKCVDVKSATHAKHTASRITWLNTRGPGVRIRKRAVNFPRHLGTGKRLTCGASLVEEHHSAKDFPQSIR
jgi:hypothetical protein